MNFGRTHQEHNVFILLFLYIISFQMQNDIHQWATGRQDFVRGARFKLREEGKKNNLLQ